MIVNVSLLEIVVLWHRTKRTCRLVKRTEVYRMFNIDVCTIEGRRRRRRKRKKKKRGEESRKKNNCRAVTTTTAQLDEEDRRKQKNRSRRVSSK